MSILDKLLNKRGIKDPTELDPQEKATYERYQLILAKKELSISDVREFLRSQIVLIEQKWRDHARTNAQKAELLPYHTVYKTLLEAIDAPEAIRAQLEEYLNKQINHAGN